MPLIFHDVEQNSEEWFQLRAGKLTGSSFSTIMANYGKGFGEPAKRLAINKAVERLTGRPIASNFSNSHMERGHEQEPVARMLYEEMTFNEVTNGGFFDCGNVGVSPDGLVNDDGLAEIKCVIANVQFDTIRKGSFDSKYKWQLVGNLRHSERDYIDYVSYCADWIEGKRLFICTIEAKTVREETEKLIEREHEFEQLVNENMELIGNFKQEANYGL